MLAKRCAFAQSDVCPTTAQASNVLVIQFQRGMRAVTHFDVNRAACEHALLVIADVLAKSPLEVLGGSWQPKRAGPY